MLPVLRTIEVTGSWVTLTGDTRLHSLILAAPPGNADVVQCRTINTLQGLDIEPGEWFSFGPVKLSQVQVRGTPGDSLKLAGTENR